VKKLYALLLCASLWLTLASCNTPPEPEPRTVYTIPAAAGAWYTEEGAEDSIGSRLDPDSLRVGLTYDRKRIFTLLRFPLDTALYPEFLDFHELQSARLWLKIRESNGVPALQVAVVTADWDENTALAQARALAENPLPAREPRDEGEGWFSIDVTDWLLAHLGGAPNHGLALFEAAHSTETAFASCVSEDDRPKLVITTY